MTLQVETHLAFIRALDRDPESLESYLAQHLKTNAVYWALTASWLLGKPDALDHAGILVFLESCQQPSGAFSAHPDFDGHLLHTLSAVQILAMLDALDDPRFRVDDAAKWVAARQQSDGSFAGDEWGEVDTRFSYCALSCLTLLGRVELVNVAAAAAWVRRCGNFDGGFGKAPGAESHAAYVFTAVGALALADALPTGPERAALVRYLASRQLPSGGLNGRPQKLADVCYSWWVLSSLAMLDRVDAIDAGALQRFILDAQDAETGGMADRAGRQPDVFHLLFGVAGLSLLGWPGLAAVDPRFCMPVSVIQRLGV